ncbi:MAG: beta-lactamase family protein, partial [Acidobacteria bacterium]|nr:beta-lactamase family protein [Acidobacteriota bacterium]
AVGRLVEEGRLGWDEEIGKHVPAFPKKQWPVTLRQLMGHTAGVGGDGGERAMIRERCETPAEGVRGFAGSPLRFQPGSGYRFSSYGWILVSAAVEAGAGEPWFGYMRARVFEPLGMRETGLDPGPDPVEVEGEDPPPAILIRELIHDPGAVRGEAARGEQAGEAQGEGRGGVAAYDTRFGSDPRYGMHVMRLVDFSCYAGASGFVSTPSDLVRFGMGMMGGKLLKPATVEALQTAQRLASGEGTGYGLGWQVRTVTLAGKPARMVGHDGEVMGGMVASLLTFPESGLVVAVTSNIAHADTAGMGMRVAEVFAKAR